MKTPHRTFSSSPAEIPTRPPLLVHPAAEWRAKVNPPGPPPVGVKAARPRAKASGGGALADDDGDRLIEAALEVLAARLRRPGEVLESPRSAKDYARLQLAHLDREAFAVLFLDGQHQALSWEVLFFGTLSQTSVYPREVVRRALAHNAGSVLLMHNHPSGIAEPSRADEALTAALKAALQLVDIRVLDHLVVGADGVASLAERGLM